MYVCSARFAVHQVGPAIRYCKVLARKFLLFLAEELERAQSMMRRGSSRRRFNRPSTLETQVSSQPTEIERV